MEINWKQNMNELGGAFMLSWVLFGGALGAGISLTMTGGLGMGVAIAVAWMAFTGAHILPAVTWCHMLTGDLSDVEGNWMENGMRLVAQVIGAALAIVLMTEAGDIETGWEATDMWITEIGDVYWSVIAMIAAGAVWWQIHTRCESEWVSAFGLMALVGVMTISGANEMGASITSGADGLVDTLVNWICDAAFIGVGALIGVKIDEMLPEAAAEASAE
ncbi:MAG TPA: hypothetical protein QF621_05090 [Candidatus Thalassarchaeaceae archaeon]|nr:hypothetical protein [Candidatus Thalassarchaeaceae archaeon]